MKPRPINLMRTIILLAVALTIGCGETPSKRRKLQQQNGVQETTNPHVHQEAVARLVETGAKTMDLELGGETRTIIAMNADQLSEAGTIQADVLNYLRKINALVLDIRSNRMTNDALVQIATLPNLKGLLPGSPQITDEGLTQLAKCESLENLDISYCATITETGLGNLSTLPNLKSLVLAGPAFGDGMFDQLAKYPALSSIQIDNTIVTDEGCAGLTKLPHLTELRIMGRQLSNLAAEHIGKLKLQKLAIVSTAINDVGMQRLANLSNLEELSLSGSMLITDAGLLNIAGMTKLNRLNIRFCRKLTADGMKHLKKLDQLIYLNIEANGLGDSGLKLAVSGKTALEQLYASGNTLTDEAMPAIGNLTNLKLLALARNKVTALGVKRLAGLKRLEELTLSETKLDVDAMGIISQLPELKMLSLTNTGLDDDGIAKLVELKKLERLIIPANPVGDKGLAELFDLQGLKLIYAAETQITKAGAASHQAINPQCIVQLGR